MNLLARLMGYLFEIFANTMVPSYITCFRKGFRFNSSDLVNVALKVDLHTVINWADLGVGREVKKISPRIIIHRNRSD